MLAPVRRKTLVEDTAQRIRDYITGEGLKGGAPLPSHRELASQLAVSLSTVRESLKLLQASGWIDIRPQQGVVVAAPNLRPLQDAVWSRISRERSSLREIWELRRLFEVGILPWVAARATPEDWERLGAAAQAVTEAVERDGLGYQADVAFHEALVQATHNSLFLALRQMAAHFFEEIQRLSSLSVVQGETGEERRVAAREHWAILESLRAGDVAQAERLMIQHMEAPVAKGLVPSTLETAAAMSGGVGND